MTDTDALARPEIQAELLSEALLAASVGFLVWDESRRYVAANRAACEILGATLEELLDETAGAHTTTSDIPIEEAAARGLSTGTARVERFDGTGTVDVVYVTFRTKTAGMPFMATVIAPIGLGD